MNKETVSLYNLICPACDAALIEQTEELLQKGGSGLFLDCPKCKRELDCDLMYRVVLMEEDEGENG